MREIRRERGLAAEILLSRHIGEQLTADVVHLVARDLAVHLHPADQ